MKTIQLQLDEQTLERAWQIAKLRHCTLEELIQEIIGQLGEAEVANDPFLGMFAHEPELIDQVIESVMKAREEHPRQPSSSSITPFFELRSSWPRAE